jgi:hypothetical protein
MSFDLISAFKAKMQSRSRAAKEKKMRKQIVKRNKKRLKSIKKLETLKEKERENRVQDQIRRRRERQKRHAKHRKLQMKRVAHREKLLSIIEKDRELRASSHRSETAALARKVREQQEIDGSAVLKDAEAAKTNESRQNSIIDILSNRLATESATAVFSALDLDGDGYISEAELWSTFGHAPNCDLQLIMAEFGGDDGRIAVDHLSNVKKRLLDLQRMIELPDAMVHISLSTSVSSSSYSTSESSDVGYTSMVVVDAAAAGEGEASGDDGEDSSGEGNDERSDDSDEVRDHMRLTRALSLMAPMRIDYGEVPKNFELWPWLQEIESKHAIEQRWRLCRCIFIRNPKVRKMLQPCLRLVDGVTLRIYNCNVVAQIVILLLLPILFLGGAAFVTVGFIMAIIQRWYHAGIVVIVLGGLNLFITAVGGIGTTHNQPILLVGYAVTALGIAIFGSFSALQLSIVEPMLSEASKFLWPMLLPFQHKEIQDAWSCCGMLSADDSTASCPDPRSHDMLTSSDSRACGVTAVSIGYEPRNVTHAPHNSTAAMLYADDALPCFDVAMCYLREYWVWWNPLYWVMALLFAVTAVAALVAAVRPTERLSEDMKAITDSEELNALNDESESDEDRIEAEQAVTNYHIAASQSHDVAVQASAVMELSAHAKVRHDGSCAVDRHDHASHVQAQYAHCKSLHSTTDASIFHGKPLLKGEFVVTIASTVDSVGVLHGINARDSSIVVTHIDSDGAVAREGHGILNVGDRLWYQRGSFQYRD